MKFNKILKSLLFGFAAFSITTSVFADGSSKQLCLKITPSVVGGEVASSYLLVNTTDGNATGTECYLTTQNPTPYCVGVKGFVSGTVTNLQVSLAGNSTRTNLGTTTGVQTLVGINYNLNNKTGVGHAQSNTFTSSADVAAEVVHSASGNVSQIACPKKPTKPTQSLIIKIPSCNTTAC
jgi:hypothetical protein